MAQNGRGDIAKLLLDHGADANAKKSYGESVLHTAVYESHSKCVKCLVEAGAGVNYRMTNGRSALHIAVEVGDMDTIQTLLKNGSDVNVTDSESQTPLHRAVLFNRLKVIDLLLACSPISIPDIRGATPLQYWFNMNHSDAIELEYARKLHKVPLVPGYNKEVNTHSCPHY